MAQVFFTKIALEFSQFIPISPDREPIFQYKQAIAEHNLFCSKEIHNDPRGYGLWQAIYQQFHPANPV